MSIQSIYFCEPLQVGHLPYLFLGANVAKIMRCVSLQSWSFFLSHCKFYSVFSRKRFSWPGLFRTWFIFSDWFLHVSFSRFQYSNLQFGSLLHSFITFLFITFLHLQRTAVLFFAIHLQRTAVLVFAIHLQRTLSLSGAIYLQRTVVLV